jgi:hypothetical protein
MKRKEGQIESDNRGKSNLLRSTLLDLKGGTLFSNRRETGSIRKKPTPDSVMHLFAKPFHTPTEQEGVPKQDN